MDLEKKILFLFFITSPSRFEKKPSAVVGCYNPRWCKPEGPLFRTLIATSMNVRKVNYLPPYIVEDIRGGGALWLDPRQKQKNF